MVAGELRMRVSVQTRTEVSDGHDGLTETWATTCSRWPAKVEPLSGKDLIRAAQIDPRATHQVTLRFWRGYGDDLASGRSRFIWHDDGGAGDRTLEIVEPPREIEYRVALQMIVKEDAA